MRKKLQQRNHLQKDSLLQQVEQFLIMELKNQLLNVSFIIFLHSGLNSAEDMDVAQTIWVY